MGKIQNISIQGDHNIVIQDVHGSHIYINSDEGARQLLQDYRQEIGEIRALLKQQQEPILQQFAEKIYNIAHINHAHFAGEGRVTIEQAGKVTIDSRMLTEKQKDRLELLEGLQRRFQKRLTEKMKTELRFKLELNLQYTKEGTNETYLKDYYIDSYEEKSADSFNQLFQDYETKLKRLLILGEAGAGKTVLLLQFGLALVELAKQDFEYPMPVLLNVATWRDENQPFETWLQECLRHEAGEYGISKKYAKGLTKENNLLLILDGLDETPEADQQVFLTKLQTYLDQLDNARPTERNYPTVILSSRKQEYLHLQTQAPVRATIDVAPLTPEAVRKELERIKQSQEIKAKILLNRINDNPEIAQKLTSAFEVHLAIDLVHIFDFSQLSTDNLVKAYLNQEIAKLEPKYPKAKNYICFLSEKMDVKNKIYQIELVDITHKWLKYPVFFNIIFFLLLFFILYLITRISFGYILDTNSANNFVYQIYLIPAILSVPFLFIRHTKKLRTDKKLNIKMKLSIYNSVFSFLRGALIGVVLGFLLGYIVGTLQWFMMSMLLLLAYEEGNKEKTKLIEEIVDKIKNIPLITSFYISIIWLFMTGFIIFFRDTIFIEKKYYTNIKPYNKFIKNIVFEILSWLSIIFINYEVILYIFEDGNTHGIEVMTGLHIHLEAINNIKYIISICLIILLSSIFYHFLSRFLLYLEGKIPLRLRTFLNRISQTGIMEKDGGQWRFRHQLIQDALAKEYKEK